MKTVALISMFLCTVCASRIFGETIVVKGGTDSIVVGTNEAIIVDYTTDTPGGVFYGRGGTNYLVRFDRHTAWAGPCEFSFLGFPFPQSTAVTFRRVQTPAITTLVLGSNETTTIVIPPGKTAKFFAGEVGQRSTISQGTNSVGLYVPDDGLELAGPLTVTVAGRSYTDSFGEHRAALSYFITEDFLEVTADGYLKGPTGTFEVLVEKSTDLLSWAPVMVQNTVTADTRAFYRLRIQK
jgi:hypothetical protein